MKKIHAILALWALSVGFAAQAFAYANPALVDLGSAGNFTILAKTGISTTGVTAITGNIGVSPADRTYLTGFSETVDSTTQFSTSTYVVGKLYAADYGAPTPTIMTAAISDMETAYTDAAGRPSAVSNLGAGTLNGNTLACGVYTWGTTLNITGDIFLQGSATDVWILQVAGDFILASGQQVHLIGGALARNVFWQIAGQTTLNTTSTLNGNVLCMTLIEMKNGATLNGKALAQSAVTLIANTLSSAASGYAGANPPVGGKAFAYPSPAKGGVINIVYNMQENGEANIRIYNDNGDLAATVKEQKLAGPQKTQVSIVDFAPGIYLYKVMLTYASGKIENLNTQKFGVTK